MRERGERNTGEKENNFFFFTILLQCNSKDRIAL